MTHSYTETEWSTSDFETLIMLGPLKPRTTFLLEFAGSIEESTDTKKPSNSPLSG